MTYCAGILVKEGLVMIADTRTNAGLDDISTYRKLHLFETPGDRVLAIATAGNLSVTQATLALLHEGVLHADTGARETLGTCATMFQAAHLIGTALRRVTLDVQPGLASAGVDYGASLLFGGQIAGGPITLYLIYGEGNFIECGPESPFLQIGEHKYGKPVLDRAVDYDCEINEALKLGLISFDSTMRSNLAVGMPLDLILLRTDALRTEVEFRIEKGDPYFAELQAQWSRGLTAAYRAIPTPAYPKKPANTAAAD
jgi:putative proteasome-type protease